MKRSPAYARVADHVDWAAWEILHAGTGAEATARGFLAAADRFCAGLMERAYGDEN
jgi:hypothetical protein